MVKNIEIKIENDGTHYIEINGYSGYINKKGLICLDREDMDDDDYNRENWKDKLGKDHLFVYLSENIKLFYFEAHECYVTVYFYFKDLLKIVSN